MPALFTLPKQVVVDSSGNPLAGALVYFYATGTSTPQNTYQDEALATPHANPVVASAAGVLPVIYLDPSLPSYRVRVANSADVQQYQVDNIPSNQNEGRTFRLTHTAPEIIFDETDASSGNQKWRVRVNAEVLSISLLNDAESVAADIFSITRVGSTQGSIAITASSIAATLGTEVLSINAGTVNQINIENAAGSLQLEASSNLFLEAGGSVVVVGQLRFSTVVSPAQITANQNDYNPTGLATTSVLRLSSDASRNITGLVAQSVAEIRIFNVGAQDIVLTNEDAASAAANRFLFGASITLQANEGILIWYDTTSSRWRSCGKHV